MTCPACRAENDPAASACIACGEALGAKSPSLSAGAVFAGRYEILGVLGRGGMGMVYRARDRDLRETVALKVIRPDLVRQQHMERRFRSEIRLARRVRHPNVCSIYGDGEDHGVLYICMELVDGTDLREVVRARGGLRPAEAFDVAVQIAEGLAAIHAVGVIHRDLKTANIMRDGRGVVRLMDFGIAKKSQVEGTTGATATGQVLGTPEYMSPEQIRGAKVDFRTDVYALGIVIYEIFTGAVPFRGETPVATIFKQLQEPPSLLTRGPRALPRSLVPVLRRALAKEPAARFPSAAEMLEALRRAREEHRADPDPFPVAPSNEAPEGGPTVDGAATTFAAAGTTQWADASPSIAETRAAEPMVDTRYRRHLLRYVAGGAAATLAAAGLWAWSRSVAPQAPMNPAGAALTLPAVPPPSPAGATTVYDVSGTVYDENDAPFRVPVKLSGKPAEYPKAAPVLKRGQRASVTVSFVVLENGDVTDVQIVESAGRIVDEAVITAYKTWKYTPGGLNTVPVRVRVTRRQTFLGG